MKPKYLYFLSGANLALLIANGWVWYRAGEDISVFGMIVACLTGLVVFLTFMIGLMQEQLEVRIGPKKNCLDLMTDEEVIEYTKNHSAHTSYCNGCER